MRPNGSPRDLEARRLRGIRLWREGRTLTEVARILGCYPSAVMRWRDASERKGDEGLRARPAPGRPPKLNSRQRRRLIRVLIAGALSRGYTTDVWTTQRIVDVIEEEFGVHYHRDHIGRLMHTLNWSWQTPDRRALERREDRIESWKEEEWPRIKKGRRTWAPTLSS